MKNDKKYNAKIAQISIVAIAVVGVTLISTQTFLSGDVINGGRSKTPIATDVVLTMTAPTNIADKRRLTLRPNVKNNWSERAEKLVLSMVLPPELSFDIESEAGCTVNDKNVVTCPQIDYLSGYQARSLTIHLKVNACQNNPPNSSSTTIPIWTMVTTSTEDVNTASNIQQDLIDVTCPRVNNGSSSSMSSSNRSIINGPSHTECRTHTCVLVPGPGPDNCTMGKGCNPDRSSSQSSRR